MKKIGFLSFGHWTPSSQSQARSASDVLLQSIDLAVEAERLGMDGAYFRVHHFARQLSSPFPLLAAVGARTQKIEIGTAVIDMRYENPHYMAEDAGAADLIAGSRLQLGISRGSPEQVIDGWRYFGYGLNEGEDDAAMGRRHSETFLELLSGKGFCEAKSASDVRQPSWTLAAGAFFREFARTDLVGFGHQCDGSVGRKAWHEPSEFDSQVR
jgi:alkanesulfonate monooxygenase SsuD/methylene tetrahydromethanopterin reductase-like flavin-dependent oxidoreductase (luciferase family)